MLHLLHWYYTDLNCTAVSQSESSNFFKSLPSLKSRYTTLCLFWNVETKNCLQRCGLGKESNTLLTSNSFLLSYRIYRKFTTSRPSLQRHLQSSDRIFHLYVSLKINGCSWRRCRFSCVWSIAVWLSETCSTGLNWNKETYTLKKGNVVESI